MDSEDVAFNNYYECLTLYITIVDRFLLHFFLSYLHRIQQMLFSDQCQQ